MTGDLLGAKKKKRKKENRKLGTTMNDTKILWIIEFKSKFFASNNVLFFKAMLTQNWTYGIQFWGTASTSNIEIL
jgi:hypothetical protein